jgi:hypothetical protein
VCVCILALIISHAAILYCHLWPVWLYIIFLYYLTNGTNFGKNFIKMKCVWWFSVHVLSKTLLILRIIQWDIILNVHTSSCNIPVIVRYSANFNFFDKFLKNTPIWNFTKNLSSGSLVLPCRWTDWDGQTDMIQLVVAIHNSVSVPKKGQKGKKLDRVK